MLSINVIELNVKADLVLNAFIGIVNESKRELIIKYGLIKAENCIITLCKNDWMIIMFSCIRHVVKASQQLLRGL